MLKYEDLYSFKPREFIDSDDENDNTKKSGSTLFGLHSKKSKLQPKKYRKLEDNKKCDDSDDDISFIGMKTNDIMEEDSNGMDDNIKVSATLKVEDMIKQTRIEAEKVINLSTSYVDDNMNDIAPLRECLNKIRRAAFEINLVEAQGRENDTGKKFVPTDNSILQGLPVVKPYSERVDSSSTVIIDDLKSTTTTNNNNNNVTNGEFVKIKTRLNGNHEWKWKIDVNDSFEKVHTYIFTYGCL
jgi:hypothetical protein